MVVVYILTDSAHLVRKLDGNFESVQLRTLFSEYFLLNKLFMKVNIVNDFADFFSVFFFFFFFNVRKNIA